MRNQPAGLSFTGDFNLLGRGPRAQQGVEYFQSPNVNPGQDTLLDEASAPDAGFREVPPEQFNRPGGNAEGRGISDADAAAEAVSGRRDATLAQFGQMSAGLVGLGPVASQAVNYGIKAGVNPDDAGVFGQRPEAEAMARAFADMGMGLAGAVDTTQQNMANDPSLAAADPYSAAAMANDMTLAQMRAEAEQQAVAATQAATAQSAASGNGGRGGSRGALGLRMGYTTSEFGQTPWGGADPNAAPGYVDRTIGDLGDDDGLGPMGNVGGGGGSNGGGRTGGNQGGGMSNRGEGGPGSTGGWADGGMIGDRPAGIDTTGYMNGGQVRGGTPLLAMGFADGGMMGAPGAPGGLGGQPDPAQMETQVNQLLRDPGVRNQIVARAQTLMQTGQLTPQEVQTMGQIAQAAMYNPALYPQLRAFALQQGMSALPPSYDPSAVMKILAVAKALGGGAGGAPGGMPGAAPGMEGQATPPGQVPPTDQAMMTPPAGMRDGGMLHGPGHGRSDSIGTVNESTGEPVKVANGEYVIPAHVVKAKGREFFDNLLRRYADLPKGEA